MRAIRALTGRRKLVPAGARVRWAFAVLAIAAAALAGRSPAQGGHTPATTPQAATARSTAPATTGIVLADQQTVDLGDGSWEVELYRNEAFQCGRKGTFTFAVFEPRGDDGGAAPLWVFLHGGGAGYYTDAAPPRYVGNEANNDEESLAKLVRRAVSGGQDTIINRRLREGWRVLVPSMCDHDLHAGEGTVYPNNPNHGREGDTVDGLLANEAALMWVADNRPTTWVVVHGTSAGSVGAFALTYALHERGIDVNAAILDAYIVTPRLVPYFAAGLTPPVRKYPGFDFAGVTAKVGRFADLGPTGVTPERVVAEDDFRAVPILDVIGDSDPHCAGQFPPLPVADGANNCKYVHGGFAAAVAAQANSPHGQLVIAGGGHSTTKQPGRVHDQVDAWLLPLLGDDAHLPFD